MQTFTCTLLIFHISSIILQIYIDFSRSLLKVDQTNKSISRSFVLPCGEGQAWPEWKNTNQTQNQNIRNIGSGFVLGIIDYIVYMMTHNSNGDTCFNKNWNSDHTVLGIHRYLKWFLLWWHIIKLQHTWSDALAPLCRKEDPLLILILQGCRKTTIILGDVQYLGAFTQYLGACIWYFRVKA